MTIQWSLVLFTVLSGCGAGLFACTALDEFRGGAASKVRLPACAVAVALLVAKCRYGFGYYDETFYIATARRFWCGDAPVAQEWNLAQFFALFTAPLVGLVETLAGGDGSGRVQR